jgi:SAM-dependent methyltransferase
MADTEAIRAFEHAGWERAAGRHVDAFATATRQFIPGLLDAAHVVAGCSVLDVACGPGFVTAAVAARGAVATGIDFSESMLRLARTLHPTIDFQEADAEALPNSDGSLDVVVSNFGIHHVPRPIKALQQAHRVLRPGGAIAFTVWAAPADNIAWRLVFDAIGRCGDMAALQSPAPGGGLATPAACLAALEQAGFVSPGARRLGGTWRHADGQALLQALRAGTARMAALLDAQPPDAIPAIIADIDRHAGSYRDTQGLAIPLAAFVAFGVRG